MRLAFSKRVAIAVALLSLSGTAHAQRAGRGYLFHEPEFRITLRGGYAVASAGSDLFDFATNELTLRKSDFSGFTGSAEFGLPITQRAEISAEIGYSYASKRSEFRHFIDNNDEPIEQKTTFSRIPIMLNARYYLSAPGRSIGKLAWIPSRVAPYIGAGAGAIGYQFRQKGDFVDFDHNSRIFAGDLTSDAWAPAAQVLGGAEFSLSPLLAFTTDARYVYSKGDVSNDFTGFNKIDLSGVSATIGLTFRL